MPFQRSGRGGRPSFVQTVDMRYVAPTINTLAASVCYFVLIPLDRPASITKLATEIGTASGNIDIGLYSYDGTTMSKLISTGTQAASSNLPSRQPPCLMEPISILRSLPITRPSRFRVSPQTRSPRSRAINCSPNPRRSPCPSRQPVS
jgi:hypothetical protein